MKTSLRVLAVGLVLLITLSSLGLTCRCQETSSEQTAKNLYQTFLIDVIGLDLTSYYVNTGAGPNHGPQSGYGYGVSYPSQLGGAVKEELLSCHLDSPQGNATSWCIIDNGIIRTFSFTAIHGSAIYNQSPPSTIFEATQNFFQKYQAFATQFYGQNTDNAYIQQALSCLSGVNWQESTDKVIGNMNLKIAPNKSIIWSFTQNNFSTTYKGISLNFKNNSVTWFGDSWNLYQVNNINPVSPAEAEPSAFDFAQNYNVTLASFEGSKVTPLQVRPNWSNMTYKAEIWMIPGVTEKSPFTSNTYSSSTTRDPLTLYLLWHFIFYFSEPIGETVGLEVGVWADNKEIAYCHEYGYLGPSPTNPTPQSVSNQPTPQETTTQIPASPQTTNEPSTSTKGQTDLMQSQNVYPWVAVASIVAAIAIGSYLNLRRKQKP